MGEIAYAYRESLYLNITNRCTNDCAFCIRSFGEELRDFNLKLDHEPTVEETLEATKHWMNSEPYSEIVFCGYGEPLIRLDAVLTISQELKNRYPFVKLRVDTNGQANLLYPKRNVARELKKSGIDRVSISLNAENSKMYVWICKPTFGLKAYNSVIQFIKDSKAEGLETQVTIVAIPHLDVEACKMVARTLEVSLRIRPYRRSISALEHRLGPPFQ